MDPCDEPLARRILTCYADSMFPIELSKAVDQAFPALLADLRFIHVSACDLDSDIPLCGIVVRVKLSRNAYSWGGHAYPHTATTDRHEKTIDHPNGRVTMSLGADIAYTDIVRLFSHELRHLAQFARGKDWSGSMTLDHLERRDIEPDCLKFEGRALKHMLLDDNLTWRNEGYANEPVGYEFAARS